MNSIRIDFGFGIERDKDGLAIPRDEANSATARIKKEAANLFGAYTLVPTHGGWTSPIGKLVEEDGYTLFTVQPGPPDMNDVYHPTHEGDPRIRQFANFIKSSLNQEAVAVTKTPCSFELI